MKRLSVIFCLLLLSVATIEAQGTPEEVQATQREFIENVALPAIRTIIKSLETQNAPIPLELKELIKLSDDPDAFYALASRHFGTGWQERLSRDATAINNPEEVVMVRARLYLSSLAANAERIGKTSSLPPAEIRTYAQNLLRQSQAARTEEAKERFYISFDEAVMKIFPREEGPTLGSFHKNVLTLLSELTDAISILVDGRSVETLGNDLTELQSRLTLITGNQELTAWLAQFDAFAKELLAYAIETDDALLMEDTRTLLKNLRTYFESLEQEGIHALELLIETKAVALKLEQPMTPALREEILNSVEALFSKIAENFPSSFSAPSSASSSSAPAEE